MKADGLHYFIKLVNEWREKYHVNQKDEIVFQNKTTMANVRFNNLSMHNIQSHSKGVENLPAAIMNPDEIWSSWKDVKTQQIVLRAYIHGDYVVLTEDGLIKDGFLTNNALKYRKGCLVTL